MSFEPRLVHPSAGSNEATDHPSVSAHPARGLDEGQRESDARNMTSKEETPEEELPKELQLLGKQLGRESIRLSGYYPAVADEQNFFDKLTYAQSKPSRQYWFQKLWARSTAAVLLLALGIAFMGTPFEPPAADNTNPSANPPVGESLFNSQMSTVGATESDVPDVRLLRGLSGEEIEGLREFEKPGTRISL